MMMKANQTAKSFAVCAALAIALGGCGGDDSNADSTGSTTVTTSTVPGAPVIGTASAGDASAVVSFTAPTSIGSSAITGYTATCTAGGVLKTGTGTASPITVTGLTNGTSYGCSVTASNAAGTSTSSGSAAVTPAAVVSGAVDPTKLLVGDSYVRTTSAGVGYAFMCNPGITDAAGAASKGPWFNADGTTWNSLTKLAVAGSVSWVSSFLAAITGSTLNVTGNGLPSHTTGIYPIQTTDPVYAYDQNPGTIVATAIAWGLPANPTVNSTARCLNGGSVGVLLTGVRLFAPTDQGNRDAVAWEVQDSCQGHPQDKGVYHYHNISACLENTAATKDVAGQHSPVVGYAADGFGIFGNLGESGKSLVNADLDECHGHTHAVTINGVSTVQYHYHKTLEFPYALGCYRGTPTTVD